MLDAACVMVASVKAHASAARPVRVFALTDFEAPELAALAAAMNDPTFELVPLAVTNVHGHFPIRDPHQRRDLTCASCCRSCCRRSTASPTSTSTSW